MVGGLSPQVEVILPCLNEAEALGWVLGRMPPWVRPIVVDNGSTDGSAEIARDHGATWCTRHSEDMAQPAMPGCWPRRRRSWR